MDSEKEKEPAASGTQREIFLKEALEEQFTFRKLDQALSLIKPLDWLIYWGLFAVLAGFFAWCFFGSIPVTVFGRGIILDPNQLMTIVSEAEGSVEGIYFDMDSRVDAGAPLIKLYDPQLAFQVDFLKKAAQLQQKEYQDLVVQVDNERVFRINFLRRQLESYEKAKEFKEQAIAILQNTLETEQDLYDKNILTAPTLNSTRLTKLSAQADLGKIMADISNTEFEIAKKFREEELWTKHKQVQDTELQLGLAKEKFQQTFVNAKEAGKVVGNFVFPGMSVTKGSPLLILQKPDAPTPPTYFYAYVPISEGKAIRPGMAARIELAKYVFKKYGYIIGKVKEVSTLPLPDTSILARLFDKSLVDTLKEKSVAEILIELETNPENPTGYRWTSGRGPDQEITIGSVGLAQVVVDTIPPIYFLIPNWGVSGGDER